MKRCSHRTDGTIDVLYYPVNHRLPIFTYYITAARSRVMYPYLPRFTLILYVRLSLYIERDTALGSKFNTYGA